MDDLPALPPNPMAALTTTLAALKQKPPIVTLKTPTFKWSAPGQYDEFHLFSELLNSWFHLQGMPTEPGDNGDRIEYVLNFQATTGHRK